MQGTRSKSRSGRVASQILLWLALGVLLAAAGAWAAWKWWPRPPAAPVSDDPRLTYPTPYRNVRPEVRYVGSAACAECHVDIVKSYARHPMGRSLAPVATAEGVERWDRAANNPFEVQGFLHLAERRGRRVFHRETCPGPDGGTVAEVEAEIAYVVGSGTHGRSYFVERDGYLFESPLSWYTEKGRWALSPGYQFSHQHFDRRVGSDCVFCHANRAERVPHTFNRYRKPIFDGHAIGCERCHGPGELHVASSDQLDIVNPTRLAPALRDAVCEQCHLGGRGRILRPGREAEDFRPGLPMHLFWSVFVAANPTGDAKRLLGHPEQMRASRCFQQSNGKLGCISCHDPHLKPAAEAKVSYYRERCLRCHEDCKLPVAERRRQDPADSCIACHMPRAETADIAHVSISDHTIPRRGKEKGQPPVPASDADDLPVVHFHRDLLGPDDPGVSRELGIMLSDLGRLEGVPAYAVPALPLLNDACRKAPADVRAGEARGCALWMLGRHADARDAFEAVLSHSPNEETTLVNAAALAGRLGRWEEAAAYGERLLAVNPWPSTYHFELARARAGLGQWPLAIKECRETLRLNPAHLAARRLLIESLLRTSAKTQARAELDRLLVLQPADREALLRWFAEQSR